MKSVFEGRTNWKEFINIVETDFAGIDDVICDGNAAGRVELFDLNGVRINSAVPGQVVIRRVGNKVEKVIM